MTLYKALTNFTFENVTVIFDGQPVYTGEAWRFDSNQYYLHLVYNISIHYVDNKPGCVFIYII